MYLKLLLSFITLEKRTCKMKTEDNEPEEYHEMTRQPTGKEAKGSNGG